MSFEVSLKFIMSINDDFCMFGQKRSFAIWTSILFFCDIKDTDKGVCTYIQCTRKESTSNIIG